MTEDGTSLTGIAKTIGCSHKNNLFPVTFSQHCTNTSHLWVDIDELINNIIYTEEQERVYNVVESLRSVKKGKQKSNRPGNYNKIANRVKLEVMKHLHDLFTLSKEH